MSELKFQVEELMKKSEIQEGLIGDLEKRRELAKKEVQTLSQKVETQKGVISQMQSSIDRIKNDPT